MEEDNDTLIEEERNGTNEESHQVPENLSVDQVPHVGMSFLSEDEVRDFYKSYAQCMGFGICKLRSKNGSDGKQKYFSLGCAKSRKMESQAKNCFYPRPSTKTNCNAKINVAIQNDGTFVICCVCVDHNHVLSPGKSRHFRCNKVLDSSVKRKLELNDEAGIRLNKSFQSFVVEAGGYDNLPFDERKCRNYVLEARKLRLEIGDTEALTNYFCRMQSRNSNLFYAIDLDEESLIKNVFWADARCRAAYDFFFDVITFDTTYLTNSYDMPFAPFVGINHHGQSILLGCGLLSNEDSDTFKWLFKSWLTCMLGRAPKAIITDQCRAMQIAIAEVFPDSYHRLCLWHIMKKIPVKFGGNAEYKMIKKELKNIVYNSLTIDECEDNWQKMVDKFMLHNNEWLKSLYEVRSKWIPVYVKDIFWAGMSTSQRSESMNIFFDDYVHSKTTLKQFVEQYNNALKSKIEKEKALDFASFNSVIPLITCNPIEKQLQKVYTNSVFKLFQDELRGLMYCNTSFLKQEGVVLTFEVVETKWKKDGATKEIAFSVQYSEVNCQVKCLCRLFEFRGILCRHMISVLIKNKVAQIPMNYILERWRKDLKRGYQSIINIYDDFDCAEERCRYNSLTPLLQEVQQIGSQNDERRCLLMNILNETKDKLIAIDSDTSFFTPNGEHSNESRHDGKKMLSPLKVRSRGRPPTKRKQSNLEHIVKKVGAKARKKVLTEKKKGDISSDNNQEKVSTGDSMNMSNLTCPPFSSVHLIQSEEFAIISTQESWMEQRF